MIPPFLWPQLLCACISGDVVPMPLKQSLVDQGLQRGILLLLKQKSRNQETKKQKCLVFFFLQKVYMCFSSISFFSHAKHPDKYYELYNLNVLLYQT